MRTAELTGAALDWAVAKCEGYTCLRVNPHRFAGADELIMTPPRAEYGAVLLVDYNFSTDWAQGGPIIEREAITVAKDGGKWLAMTESNGLMEWGASYLEAAMRCYVASKRGEEVDVPDELGGAA